MRSDQRGNWRPMKVLPFQGEVRDSGERCCHSKEKTAEVHWEAHCMRCTFKRALAVLILVCSISESAVAGLFEDGINAWDRGDYFSAMRFLRPLADRGDPKAQIRVGVMNQHGWGVRLDYSDAMNWF